MLKRKVNRLPHQKLYHTKNSFFITICVKDRICCLSDIDADGRLVNTDIGSIVENTWLSIGDFFENIGLDLFVVMPNHFHGIITFYDKPISNITNKNTNLSDIVSKFKSLSWYNINNEFVAEPLRFHKEYNLLTNKTTGLKNLNATNENDLQNGNDVLCGNGKHSPTTTFTKNFPSLWQKSFYDHIIRGEKDLQRIQEYIINNPIKWRQDILHPKNETKFQTWQQKS
ncbi:MAG: hypothetical protein WCK98_00915 [bacterium]